MNDFRKLLFDAVLAARDDLAFVTDVRQEAGLLRITLKMDQPAYFNHAPIDHWMSKCVREARIKVSSDRFALPIFRGVKVPLLERVLRAGIDVEPTNAHWYGGELEKALEYGGDYPAVLIIDGNRIERAVLDVEADAPAHEHVAAKAWSVGDPARVRDGKYLRYSRLPIDNSKRGTSYETSYAWYIPGDPKEALLGVIECRPRAEV